MKSSQINLLALARSVLSLFWLTGPIFDKELRVSSRRRRNYLLRFTYVALLAVFLALLWLEEVPRSSSAVYRVSRMARVGSLLAIFVVWFQFWATQLVAVILLSTAISDEIHHRTLGVLMTTPITALQIVVGKLASRLLQIFLLLAVSLPVLAIIRVFGAVPWDYLCVSLCITLCTVLFVGSISLFYSVFTRRAYVVIVAAVITLGVLFLLLPLLVALLLLDQIISEKVFFSILLYVNPYVLLAAQTDQSLSLLARGPRPPWLINCGILLAGSFLLLVLCIWLVRRLALRQATGQPALVGPTSCERRRRSGIFERLFKDWLLSRPVLWKEFKSPLLGRWKVLKIILCGLAALLLVLSYLGFSATNAFGEEAVQMLYICSLFGLGVLASLSTSPTVFTTEKEAGTWSLLLTTTLSEAQILKGKFAGSIRRQLPAYLPLFAHLGIICIVRIIHPLGVLQIFVVFIYVVLFLTSSGLYFSARFKHTTTAVIVNFAFAAILWGLLSMLFYLTAGILHASHKLPDLYTNCNPFVQLIVIVDACVPPDRVFRFGSGFRYLWLGSSCGAFAATLWLVVIAVVYLAGASLFFTRAGRLLRRSPC